MLVVSDTSPLRYLIETSVVDVLPQLYGTVFTTADVIQELQHDAFPPVVSRWASAPPAWLKIGVPTQLRFEHELDTGEASALSLAVELHADLVLIDERKATRLAFANGMKTAGTLAVLRDAGLARLIDFHEAIEKLTQETQFFHTPALINHVVADYDRTLRERQNERTRDEGRGR